METDTTCGLVRPGLKNRSEVAQVEGESQREIIVPQPSEALPPVRVALVILILSLTTTMGSMSTGLVTIGIPRIAVDISIDDSLILWPGSVYSLANGCCLVLAASLADMIGNRIMNFGGCLVLAVFIIASGLAQNSTQFIIFRAFQGIGAAMFFPTCISILSQSAPAGRPRNVGLSCLGLAQPVGLQIGLVLAGVFENTSLTWRFGFYLCGSITLACCLIAYWFIPPDQPHQAVTKQRLLYNIDWVGICIAAITSGILSYVLAKISESTESVRDISNITLLACSFVLTICFVFWMHRQEKRGRPALIPNSLWKSLHFSSISIMVVICWAVANSMDWFFSLFFQLVQNLSPIDTALRYLPNVLFGIFVNLLTGLLVHRLPTNIFVIAVSVISAASPLLMALIDPSWSFWVCAFWAVLTVPIAQDVIFTVANLIITTTFPKDMQAVAGGVFATISMLGTALGISITAIVSHAVTKNSASNDENSPEALMLGYRAAFWVCFGLMVVMILTGTFGLRRLWKIPHK